MASYCKDENDIQIPQTVRNVITCQAVVSFSRRAQLHIMYR